MTLPAPRRGPVVPDVVLLAAGRGTRLGGTTPKPLTVLPDGESILARQLRLLTPLLQAGSRVVVVVGHREQELRAALAGTGARAVRAPAYATTNTARSLQVGLSACDRPERGVLWLNGDVVFAPGLAVQVAAGADGRSFVGVQRGRTAEEEVKYRLDHHGDVTALSKQVRPALGEAIGVNHVAADDRGALDSALARVGDQDYFEAAVELTIAGGVRWHGLDLSEHTAVEVDTPADLVRAGDLVRPSRLLGV